MTLSFQPDDRISPNTSEGLSSSSSVPPRLVSYEEYPPLIFCIPSSCMEERGGEGVGPGEVGLGFVAITSTGRSAGGDCEGQGVGAPPSPC